MNLFQFLAEVFFKDLVNVAKLAKTLKTNPRALLKTFYTDPTKFAKDLGKLGTKERKQFTTAIQKAQQATGQSDEVAVLSSSWIASGHYKPFVTGDTGDLTITVRKSGNSYTYPGVSKRVWEAMKKAKGSNGSGAGSVFWAMYLRSYRGSAFGQLQAKVFKLAGVKSISPDTFKKILSK